MVTLDEAIEAAEGDVTEDEIREREEADLDVLDVGANYSVGRIRTLLKRYKAMEKILDGPRLYLHRDLESGEKITLQNKMRKNIMEMRQELENAGVRHAQHEALKTRGHDAHYNNEPSWWPGKSLGRKCPEHLKR